MSKRFSEETINLFNQYTFEKKLDLKANIANYFLFGI